MSEWPKWAESERAHVVQKIEHCCISGCQSVARWDIAPIDAAGQSGDWTPYCTYHGRRFVKALESIPRGRTRNAEK